MKPTNVIDMQRQGDLGGQKIAMEFDASSIAHIMSVLTDLYSDQELAVIREYSTNARDSHIAAGVTRPIEITTPNTMSPYFKIKDFGLGLSVDDINKIYSKYGASTKRGTNDQTGMLGLGCKSALTYTNQFILTSHHNGMKITVSIGRQEDGAGVMEIVSTVATTEPNGVEITVPVKRDNRFAYKAARFFQYWEAGTVLVDGKEQPRLLDAPDVKHITGGMYSVPGHLVEQDTVVMGGVPYPAASLYDGFRHYGGQGFKVVAFVEIGDIAFVPSREALAMTPTTKATLADLNKKFTDALWQTVQDDIDAAPDHPEALKRFISWEKSLGAAPQGKTPTYLGTEVPKTWAGKFMFWHPNRGRYSVSSGYNKIDHNTVEKSVIVVNFDPTAKLTSTHKEKMRRWASDNSLSPQTFVLCEGGHPGLPWVNGEGVVEWDDIKAVKLNTGPRAKRVVRYEIWDATKFYFVPQDVPAASEFQFVSPKERLGSGVMKALAAEFPKAVFVQMGENRWEKFKRDNKGSMHIREACLARLNKVRDTLTDIDRQVVAMDYYDKNSLTALDESKVDDPDLVSAIKVAKGLTTGQRVLDYNKIASVARSVGVHVPDIKVPSAFAKYPLLRGQFGSSDQQHVYIYINAVYAAIQNGRI